ncbi:membrane protein [Actinomadura rubrobrunea]|uniref:Membrane protein n=1 Tax=Actinomadura rubrobrunea TaxID=115335 RepID=A0A9W6PUA4_9ACTN|nr:DUF2269 family protein [Actinomadura rubrobrunea]GLW63341.1 membrane protein [Actinomadura rubrobrunea]
MDTTTHVAQTERRRTSPPAGSAGPSAGADPRRGPKRLSPRMRKLTLLIHVIAAVSWLGLDVGLLTLSVTGRISDDPETIRAAYVAMDVFGDVLLIPVALFTLVTGVLLGMGTRWGLLRYHWVLTKLVLTLVAFTATVAALRPGLEQAARDALRTPPEVGAAASDVLVAPCVALALYTFMTVLSVYKPWGMTRFARERLGRPGAHGAARGK